MLEKHIIHIGLPRCGSTWLWKNIFPSLDQTMRFADKENKILFNSADINKYYAHYKKYQISANMNPNIWMMDQSIIQSLNRYATHVSCTLRNPFQFVERYYNFLSPTHINSSEFVNFVIMQGMLQYSKIYNRWHANFHKKIKFFLFEKLENDSEQFFKEIFQFYEFDVDKIPPAHLLSEKINVNIKNNKIWFTDAQIKLINQEIDQFSNLIDIPLTHWMK